MGVVQVIVLGWGGVGVGIIGMGGGVGICEIEGNIKEK